MQRLTSRVPKLWVSGFLSFIVGLLSSACDESAKAPEQGDTGSGSMVHVSDTHPVGEADDQPQGANALGELPLSMQALSRHEVSLQDRTDFFRFKVPRYGQARLHLDKEHDAALFVIVSEVTEQGDKGAAVIDFWQEEQSADHKVILPAGEYLLEVKNRSEALIPYALGMALAPAQGQEAQPEPGNEPSSSTQLGLMGEADLHLAGYVGIVDPVDFYRVQVPANKQLRVQGASEDGAFDISLLQLQDNAQVSVRELGVAAGSGVRDRLEDAQAGVYFVKVESRHRPGAMYQVTLGLEQK